VVLRRILGAAEMEGILYPTPSPDGERLAFWDGATGNMAVRDLRTGRVEFLTHAENWESHGGFPRFSPDGRLLAYQWWDGAGGGAHQLRVVHLETGEVDVVYAPEPQARGHFPALGSWSPDGRHLAATLSFPDGTNRITLLALEDGRQTTLRSLDWRFPGRVTFSPDGEWLAYDVGAEGHASDRQIYLLARDGSREIPLVEAPGHHRVLGWLPGGGPFFYLTEREGRTRLMAMAVEDGNRASEPWTVRDDLWHVQPAGFSEEALFVAPILENARIVLVPFDPVGGRVTGPPATIGGGAGEGSVRPSERLRFRAWSPDGERIAYTAQDLHWGGAGTFPPDRLILRSVRGGGELTVRLPFRYIQSLDWSPDGGRLALHASEDRGRFGIHILDLATEELETVVRDVARGTSYWDPRWSADGRTLHLRRDDAGSSAFLRLDPVTGEEEELFRSDDGTVRGFAPAPDDRALAMIRSLEESGTWEIVVVPLDGEDPRQVVRVEEPDWIRTGALEWTPDGERLLYLRGSWDDEARGPRFRIVRADGTEDREVEGLADVASSPGFDFRVHPDGQRLGVTAGTARYELWTLENLPDAAVAEEDRDAVDGP